MFLSVANWEKFQHYKDRNPPWIKLHRSLLTDYQFACLHDASKLHLMLLWIVASQQNGVIPDDPTYLKNLLNIDTKPDLNELIEKGFLVRKQNASNAQAKRSPETETETDKEKYPTGTKRKSKQFKKPTRSELIAYAEKRGFENFDPDAFIDHYESNGWRVGRNPMKSWPHTVSKWNRENAERTKTRQRTSQKSAGQNAADFYEDCKAFAAGELGQQSVCQTAGPLRLVVDPAMDDE